MQNNIMFHKQLFIIKRGIMPRKTMQGYDWNEIKEMVNPVIISPFQPVLSITSQILICQLREIFDDNYKFETFLMNALWEKCVSQTKVPCNVTCVDRGFGLHKTESRTDVSRKRMRSEDVLLGEEDGGGISQTGDVYPLSQPPIESNFTYAAKLDDKRYEEKWGKRFNAWPQSLSGKLNPKFTQSYYRYMNKATLACVTDRETSKWLKHFLAWDIGKETLFMFPLLMWVRSRVCKPPKPNGEVFGIADGLLRTNYQIFVEVKREDANSDVVESLLSSSVFVNRDIMFNQRHCTDYRKSATIKQNTHVLIFDWHKVMVYYCLRPVYWGKMKPDCFYLSLKDTVLKEL